LVALIAVVIIGAVTALGTNISGTLTNAANKIGEGSGS
jgi:Flp pilus assembly pilin Flp